MANPILAILIALILAFLVSEIFRYFKLPRVIGQILAGILLGIPIIKSTIFTKDVTDIFLFITNIGMILLFFFVGLEINLKSFRKNFKESSLIAIFNTLLPLTIGFLVAKYIFNFDNIVSLILGVSVSVSSQSISLDILEELKFLKSKIGNLIIISGTVDDVFELLLIGILLVFFHSVTLEQPSIYKSVFGMLIFIIIVIISKILLVPFAMRIFEKEKSKSTLFMGSLIIVFLISYLSELFGFGSFIGALIAGMLIRQTLLIGEDRKPWRINEISHTIHMISFGFLVPLFFVNVGLNTNIATISSSFLLIFVFIIIDIAGTLAGTIIGVLLSKGTFSDGIIVGWGVIPKGDTELAIATLALNNGLINIEIFTVIITVAIFSTFVAPIIFKLLINKTYLSR